MEMRDNILLREREELHRICIHSKVVIYGAGVVANALLFHLALNRCADCVFCIAVTDKEGQPDNVLGIPVCTLDEVCSLSGRFQYIIATLERSHAGILEILEKRNIYDAKAVSNLLYAKLRQENPSLEFEILQNIKRADAGLHGMLRKIENDLWKMKRCILYGAHSYEETLTPAEYPDALKEWYEQVTGKQLNLSHPVTYNEKVQWIKLYGITPLMTQLTDKYQVREWVRSKIGESFLVKLLGVWDSFDQIDFSELPDRFVLKCTHGCGYNLVVRDKKQFNVREAKRKFDSWQNINFAFAGGLEMQYKDIVPRIIAEEYLENVNDDLYDYKFWCFDGKPEFIMFLSERNKKLKMNNFDCQWNPLSFTYDYERSTQKIPKPQNLSRMLEIAEILSADFPHVRVDLYHLNNGDIRFGEMTFTSASGVCNWSDDKINYRLGQLINVK